MLASLGPAHRLDRQTDRQGRQNAAGCPQFPRPGSEAGGGRAVARRRSKKAGAARLEGLAPAPRMAPVSEQLEPQGAGGDPAGATPLPSPPAVEEPRRENGGEWCPGSGESGAQPRAAAEAPGSAGCPGSAAAPEPPEGGWGWVVMLAAMWCNGAVFGIQNSCGVLFVSMLRLFGSSEDKQLVFKTGEGRPGKGSGRRPARSASGLPRLQPGHRGVPAGGSRSGAVNVRAPGAAGARPLWRAGPGRSRPGPSGIAPWETAAALTSLSPGQRPPGVSGEEQVCSRFFHSWVLRHLLSCSMGYSAYRNLHCPAPVSLKVSLN